MRAQRALPRTGAGHAVPHATRRAALSAALRATLRTTLRAGLGVVGLRAATLVLAGTATSGCGLVPPIALRSPTISFAGLGVTSIGLSEIGFRVDVLAENPNDVDVPLTELRFELDLFGAPFASGAPPTGRATIPAAGKVEIPVSFRVPTRMLLDTLAQLRLDADAAIDYRLSGSAKWGSSPFRLEFERSDRIDPLRRLRELHDSIAGART